MSETQLETSSGETIFSDVAPGEWYAPAVKYISDLGYINGYPDGTFRPDNSILVQDAYKILVNVLGYGIAAEEDGGYPNGYINRANKLRLSSGVSRGTNEPALRGDILMMVYEALDADMMVREYSASDTPSYTVKKGETLRSWFAYSSDIYHTRGVVTANNSTWLLSPNTDIGEGDIEIDGQIFRSGSTNAANYIGQEVEVYYYEDERSGEKNIKTIAPTTSNTVLKFSADDVSSLTVTAIDYYKDEKDKAVRVYLADDCLILYNNRILSEVMDKDLVIKNGDYTLIDNNGDRKYDCLFLNEEENVLAEKVFETGEIYFQNTFTVNGARYISIEPDETQTYKISDGSGNPLSITDIKKDDILTVSVSRDLSYTKIVVSTDIRNEVIYEVNEDEVLIGSDWVESLVDKEELEVGSLVKIYLNYKEEIVHTGQADSESAQKKYGYIVKIGKDGIFGAPDVLMLRAGAVSNKEEENKENLDDKNKISTLYCKNESVETMKLNDRIRVDGQMYNARDYNLNSLVGPVIYTTDSGGRLKTIETPELIGGIPGREIQYSAKEKVFGGNVVYGGFGIDENTRVVCVPEESSPDMDDYLVYVKVDNRDTAQKFNAQGYVQNPITGNAELLVITYSMNADTVTSINYKSSQIGIVTEAAFSISGDGEEYYQITVLSAAGEKVYDTKSLNSNNDILSELKKGDMIYYELDNDGYMQNARLIVNPADLTAQGLWDRATANECLYGRVEEMQLDKIDVVNVRRADILHIMINNVLEEIKVPTRNAPVVFVYDEAKKQFSVAIRQPLRAIR